MCKTNLRTGDNRVYIKTSAAEKNGKGQICFVWLDMKSLKTRTVIDAMKHFD